MNQSPSIFMALCLPQTEITALLQGRTVAALPSVFITPGQMFGLQPIPDHLRPRSYDQPYRQNVMTMVDIKPMVEAIAVCEFCRIIEDLELIDRISSLTIWSKDFLARTITKKKHIFLTCLRVYQLNEPYLLEKEIDNLELVGKRIRMQPAISETPILPVLADPVFKQRSQQLEKLQPPLHPDLEALQSELFTQVIQSEFLANFDDTLQRFLGWIHDPPLLVLPDWLGKIAETGHSSDGHQFEKLVRQSFLDLGFRNYRDNSKTSLDPTATGGAGGLDFCCDFPYLLIGECKSSGNNKMPSSVVAQLMRLGLNNLGKEDYDQAIKIVLSVGQPTKEANTTAKSNQMNILRPETLERLVKLHAIYPGSIDLIQLESCLKQEPFSLAADEQVNQEIEQILLLLKTRSHVILSLKQYLTATQTKLVGIEALHGVYTTSNPPQLLHPQALHEIAIELSSPLTGYLGRKKGDDWQSDRFYWLRDLTIQDV